MSWYDIKQSSGEAPVLWKVEYSFIATLAMVAPDRVLYMGQIELFDI